MCGRYAFVDVSELYERFGVNNRIEELAPRYNAAPGNIMPVVINQSPTEAQLMRWGLIPSWAKDPKIGYRMINARAETLLKKPSYKRPLVRQRCLIPANGFYEWQKENGKQPYYFKHPDNDIFAFAGLFEVWKDAEEKEIRSFTIITKAATGAVKQIHDRMPVILEKEAEADWINRDIIDEKTVMEILNRNNNPLEAYPVSKAVNKATSNDESLIKPINNL